MSPDWKCSNKYRYFTRLMIDTRKQNRERGGKEPSAMCYLVVGTVPREPATTAVFLHPKLVDSYS